MIDAADGAHARQLLFTLQTQGGCNWRRNHTATRHSATQATSQAPGPKSLQCCAATVAVEAERAAHPQSTIRRAQPPVATCMHSRDFSVMPVARPYISIRHTVAIQAAALTTRPEAASTSSVIMTFATDTAGTERRTQARSQRAGERHRQFTATGSCSWNVSASGDMDDGRSTLLACRAVQTRKTQVAADHMRAPA